MTRIDELVAQRDGLKAYLLLKVQAGDWHGVQDAASDIREIEARLDEEIGIRDKP